VGQMGFFDLSRRYEGLDRKRDPLPLIANLAAIIHQGGRRPATLQPPLNQQL
jgi:hypothetical protein